jgi:hypothetical protein
MHSLHTVITMSVPEFRFFCYHKLGQEVVQLVESVLRAGRSRVRFPMGSLRFVINVILQAALWHWNRLSLKK